MRLFLRQKQKPEKSLDTTVTSRAANSDTGLLRQNRSLFYIFSTAIALGTPALVSALQADASPTSQNATSSAVDSRSIAQKETKMSPKQGDILDNSAIEESHPSPQSSNVSESSHTEVSINGQLIPIPPSGNLHKIIVTDEAHTSIDISVQSNSIPQENMPERSSTPSTAPN
jgi:hypothetical protein